MACGSCRSTLVSRMKFFCTAGCGTTEPRREASHAGGRLAASEGMSPDHQKCTICGIVLDAERPPAHCPECGALAAMFRPTDEPPHGIEHNPLQPRDPRELSGEVLGPHSELGAA